MMGTLSPLVQFTYSCPYVHRDVILCKNACVDSFRLSSYFVLETAIFVHTDTVAELQGYVHWLKRSGWNIPGFVEEGGKWEGLHD